eukprot:jgi/Tetstr1/424819/TSEL_015322.t1
MNQGDRLYVVGEVVQETRNAWVFWHRKEQHAQVVGAPSTSAAFLAVHLQGNVVIVDMHIPRTREDTAVSPGLAKNMKLTTEATRARRLNWYSGVGADTINSARSTKL